MSISPLNKSDPRKQRLMRQGFCLTGAGLCGLLVGIGLLLEAANVSLPLLVLFIVGGVGLATLGFGLMVVAADPFGDEELERIDELPRG